jgi:diguanylate cyclase (GGDEF)-like protein/PAS domain S-box-containing protein
MWLLLAATVALAAAQWFAAGAGSREQAADAARVQLAEAQRLHAERIARMAALSQRESAEDALAQSLQRSRDEASLLDAQLAATPAAHAWRERHDTLWSLTEALLAGLRSGDYTQLGPLIAEVQREADATLAAASALRDELAAGAAARRDERARQLQHVALLSVALLLFLGLAVAEPAARFVRRQHLRLAAQAGELERLVLAAERTHNVVLVTDAERRTVWANDAFTRLSGYTLAEAIGRTPDELLHGERTDAATAARLRGALDAGHGVRVELLHRAKDGREYWVDLDVQPLVDDAGRPSGFVHVETDITERVEERLKRAALLAALPVGVVLKDAAGTVVDCNPAAEQVLRLPRPQLLGHGVTDRRWRTVREDLSDYPLADQPSSRALASGEPVRGEVMGVLTPDGELRWLLVNSEPMRDAAGRVAGAVACFVDVTEQRARERLLALTVEGSGVGVWQWNVADGTASGNERLWRMLGYERAPADATARAWETLVHPEDRAGWRAALRAHLADPTVPYRCVLRLQRADGGWASVISSGSVIERRADGRPVRMAGTHVDMTEQLALHAQLRDSARTDALTRLPNRSVVFERVELALRRWQQPPHRHFAVLFMDFDRFKQVNDTYGHTAGDQLLRQIAQRLQGALRGADLLGRAGAAAGTAARIGGDEFVVLLEDLRAPDDALRVAERLVEVLAKPYAVGARMLHSGASIGVVTCERAGPDAETVLRDADTAMYEAKRAGRGRWVLFDPSMHERLERQMALEHELRRALAADELSVAYQPVVDLRSGRTVGLEALVRWRHPTRGAISPAEFIPVAEECGLIDAVGSFVLRTACRRFAAWREALGAAAPQRLAVNLSRAQLKAPGLVAEVGRVLAASALPAPCLQLEVTESLAAQDEGVQATLRELKALGVRLALDDFGTGYSSLACLHLLPVDTVKIDRSFVSRIEGSEHHRTLIEATIRVARSLAMETVAEGIETASQSLQLYALECDKGQGYLFSPPLPETEVEPFLRHRMADALAA